LSAGTRPPPAAELVKTTSPRHGKAAAHERGPQLCSDSTQLYLPRRAEPGLRTELGRLCCYPTPSPKKVHLPAVSVFHLNVRPRLEKQCSRASLMKDLLVTDGTGTITFLLGE